MRRIHAALVARDATAGLRRRPVYQHWEDEPLDIAPLYEVLWIRAAPAGIQTSVRSSREGAAIEGWLTAFYDARDALGARALIFDAADRATLRAAGFRGSSYWKARWSPGEAGAIIAAFDTLATLQPRVLLPEDLPRGSEWPWPDLLFHALYADEVRVTAEGRARVLETRLDGETHRLREHRGERWDALWAGWQAGSPPLRLYADWLRDRGRG